MRTASNVLSPGLVEQFTQTAVSPDPDLAEPALLIARIGYPHLDPTPWLARLDEMGSSAAELLSASVQSDTPHGPINSLNGFIFKNQGFVGNTTDYDDPRNSFLNQVLERRTGIPITLALVYIEVARRAGIRVDGVNFPGHFLLRFPLDPDGDHDSAVFIDPFDSGTMLSETDCRALLRTHAGNAVAFEPSLLAPATKQQILGRMLMNLKRIYLLMRSFPQGHAITELLLAINPSALSQLRDRGLLAYRLNNYAAALHDLETYLKFASHGDDSEESQQERVEIWGHVKSLRRKMASLN